MHCELNREEGREGGEEKKGNITETDVHTIPQS